MGIFGVFNLIGSMVLINLVIINPPPPPFKCDPPSIRAGGSRQEVCIHPDSVWKRTYACVPFGLWRRSGYPTGDSGEKDDLKAAKKLFGKFRDDYLRCLIEAHFQDNSNVRLLEYESPVLVKPTVHGSIFKYPKVNNDGSTHKKNLAYSSSETLESYEANLQNLLLLDAEIGERNEWFFGTHYDDTYMTSEGELKIIDCNITGKKQSWWDWWINNLADASNFWEWGNWDRNYWIYPGTSSSSKIDVCRDENCGVGSKVAMEAFGNILVTIGSERTSWYLLRYTKKDVAIFKKRVDDEKAVFEL
ncbi:hypothetical protein TrLO_g14025 [Triparma laevis f. longispina]|uniref:C-type lectin domain-containing protein n=1 Tax=Triparma laevis f. longispina TaxID=1714387 RepID=A0A9W6ZHV4_9STRA|nr:hypothetical protein TrLO_g14025 [Triparma laevis f. longispina]